MYLSDCPLTFGEDFTKVEGAGGRVVEQEVLHQRVVPLLDKVPITRVSDISRLEQSELPVFTAITPLARDLTTHMGKGATAMAARLSAIMEGIERVSAETVRGVIHNDTYTHLAKTKRCIDPERFDLPPTTTYRKENSFDWVAGWDLIGRHEIHIPADLCVSPPKEGILDQVDTNGLASGSSFGEAIRHALLELIERDASSQHLFFDFFGTTGMSGPSRIRIDKKTLSANCKKYVNRIEADRIELVLEEITCDIGVPVIACYVIDRGYPTATGPTQMIFGGWGCDTDPEHAVVRALTEAHQSRIGTLQSARDSFNIMQEGERTFSMERWRSVLEAACGAPIGKLDETSNNIATDVEFLLNSLMAIGVDQVVVVDMSDPELGIPVVRVRVPGMSVFMVDRRRVGWRCMRHIL
ncbi:YcaO-like family protein [Pseudahrensia aquimaris]|uniref:YcaO-like family protein n=1 Tax=Pseudahrensia aquimaris TaxID=744461 RepID=A0ABW3FK65_9HYPH